MRTQTSARTHARTHVRSGASHRQSPTIRGGADSAPACAHVRARAPDGAFACAPMGARCVQVAKESHESTIKSQRALIKKLQRQTEAQPSGARTDRSTTPSSRSARRRPAAGCLDSHLFVRDSLATVPWICTRACAPMHVSASASACTHRACSVRACTRPIFIYLSIDRSIDRSIYLSLYIDLYIYVDR
jgi:hypothetical protein